MITNNISCQLVKDLQYYENYRSRTLKRCDQFRKKNTRNDATCNLRVKQHAGLCASQPKTYNHLFISSAVRVYANLQ